MFLIYIKSRRDLTGKKTQFPSGYVNIALENDSRNSGLKMVIFHRYVKFPEGFGRIFKGFSSLMFFMDAMSRDIIQRIS